MDGVSEGCRCTIFATTYGDSKVIATSELSDLTNVSERSAHDDGLVAELLVVVVDLDNGLDTGVLLLLVLLLVVGLVPVKDTANEGRDQESTSLSGSNGLDRREHQGQVGVDVVLGLQDVGSLDTLVGRGNLDEDAVLGDTGLLVELLGVSQARAVVCAMVEHTSMIRRAFLTEASVSKENLASTSVETLPGTIWRISLPNWTRRASRTAST